MNICLFASIAWLLGPILFGKIVDGICIQWENSCRGKGACRLYDNDIFRLRMLGFQTGFRFIGLILLILAIVSAIVTKKFHKQEAKAPEMAMEVTVDFLKSERDEREDEEK